MTPEEFRSAGHQLINWIADYRTRVEQMPVRASAAPGAIRGSLPVLPPVGGDTVDALLADIDTLLMPGITQVQHPMHFGWFPSNATLASVLGDIASSGLGTLGISWESCPALTEVEQVVCDWMRQLVGLSDHWHGTIFDTASSACVVALVAARERTTAFSGSRAGLQAEAAALRIYTTADAHSSVGKAAALAGFGATNVHVVPHEPATRVMQAQALADCIERDRSAGHVPCAVVATVGTTATTAIDPLAAIVPVAGNNNVWLHVDAAMAGSAMLLPECRHLWHGIEGADSLSWNPHKWMGTILDTSLFYVRDVQHLVRVMSTNPSYLQSDADGQVTQYRDWGIPLGRRFRALKLWFQLRIDGPDAIRARLRRDLDNARWLAKQVAATPGWQLAAPLTLQTVCVRHTPPGLDAAALNTHTRAWIERINSSGQAFLTGAALDGTWIARISIGVEHTQRAHVAALWRLMQNAASFQVTS